MRYLPVSRTVLLLSLILLLAPACTQEDAAGPQPQSPAELLAQAEAAFENEDYERVLAICSDILQHDPGNAVAYVQRGWAYQGLQQHQRAIEDLTKAIERDPENIAAYYLRGWGYKFSLQQTEKGEQDLTHATALQADDAEDYFARGKAYYFLDNYQEALADFTQAIERNPEKAEYYSRRAMAYSALRNYQEALADFTHAIERDPDDADYYYHRAWVYFYSGNYQQAFEDALAILQHNPECRDRYHETRAAVFSVSGDYQQALLEYDELMKVAPDDASGHNDLGYTYQRLGHYDQAIRHWSKAIELNADYLVPYINRGHAYALIGEYDKAEVDCQALLQRDDPQWNGFAHYCLGLIALGRQGETNYRKALEHIEQAMDLYWGEYEKDEMFAWYYAHLGRLKTWLHRPPEKRLADYQAAISRNPEYMYAYFLAGTQSEGKIAIDYYSTAIRLEPQYAISYLKRGQIYQQQGDVDQARADFEQAAKLAVSDRWRAQAQDALQSLDAPAAAPTPPSMLTPASTPGAQEIQEKGQEEVF